MKIDADLLAQNLERRLLVVNTRGDSVVTLAHWIVFYRQQQSIVQKLLSTLCDAILSSNEERRKILYFSVLHKIFTFSREAQSNDGGLDEFKVKLAEEWLLPKIIPNMNCKDTDVQDMLGEWKFIAEDVGLSWDEFQSAVSSGSDDQSGKGEKKTVSSADNGSLIPSPSVAKPSLKRLRSLEETDGEIHSNLIPHCRKLATMQITVELRKDAMTRLSSTLEQMPKENMTKIKNGSLEENLLPDSIAQLDMVDANNVLMQYREILEQQVQLKQQLMEMLIQAKEQINDENRKQRCLFGANEAAQEFEAIREKIKLVRAKKILVEEALELEGLDMDMEPKVEDNDEKKYESFSWYKKSKPSTVVA